MTDDTPARSWLSEAPSDYAVHDYQVHDPMRDELRQHPYAFIPEGAEPPTSHRCLGLRYSTIVGVAFLTLLVPGFVRALPAQNFTCNWKTRPTQPRDGIRVHRKK